MDVLCDVDTTDEKSMQIFKDGAKAEEKVDGDEWMYEMREQGMETCEDVERDRYTNGLRVGDNARPPSQAQKSAPKPAAAAAPAPVQKPPQAAPAPSAATRQHQHNDRAIPPPAATSQHYSHQQHAPGSRTSVSGAGASAHTGSVGYSSSNSSSNMTRQTRATVPAKKKRDPLPGGKHPVLNLSTDIIFLVATFTGIRGTLYLAHSCRPFRARLDYCWKSLVQGFWTSQGGPSTHDIPRPDLVWYLSKYRSVLEYLQLYDVKWTMWVTLPAQAVDDIAFADASALHERELIRSLWQPSSVETEHPEITARVFSPSVLKLGSAQVINSFTAIADLPNGTEFHSNTLRSTVLAGPEIPIVGSSIFDLEDNRPPTREDNQHRVEQTDEPLPIVEELLDIQRPLGSMQAFRRPSMKNKNCVQCGFYLTVGSSEISQWGERAITFLIRLHVSVLRTAEERQRKFFMSQVDDFFELFFAEEEKHRLLAEVEALGGGETTQPNATTPPLTDNFGPNLSAFEGADEEDLKKMADLQRELTQLQQDYSREEDEEDSMQSDSTNQSPLRDHVRAHNAITQPFPTSSSTTTSIHTGVSSYHPAPNKGKEPLSGASSFISEPLSSVRSTYTAPVSGGPPTARASNNPPQQQSGWPAPPTQAAATTNSTNNQPPSNVNLVPAPSQQEQQPAPQAGPVAQPADNTAKETVNKPAAGPTSQQAGSPAPDTVTVNSTPSQGQAPPKETQNQPPPAQTAVAAPPPPPETSQTPALSSAAPPPQQQHNVQQQPTKLPAPALPPASVDDGSILGLDVRFLTVEELCDKEEMYRSNFVNEFDRGIQALVPEFRVGCYSILRSDLEKAERYLRGDVIDAEDSARRVLVRKRRTKVDEMLMMLKQLESVHYEVVDLEWEERKARSEIVEKQQEEMQYIHHEESNIRRNLTTSGVLMTLHDQAIRDLVHLEARRRDQFVWMWYWSLQRLIEWSDENSRQAPGTPPTPIPSLPPVPNTNENSMVEIAEEQARMSIIKEEWRAFEKCQAAWKRSLRHRILVMRQNADKKLIGKIASIQEEERFKRQHLCVMQATAKSAFQFSFLKLKMDASARVLVA